MRVIMTVVLSVMIGGLGGHAASNAAAFMGNPWGLLQMPWGGANGGFWAY